MTDNDSQKTLEKSYNADSWASAAALIKPLGTVAGNFTSAVRTLMVHHESSSAELSAGSQNHMLRMLYNGTIRANYYFATKSYRPELFPTDKKIQQRDLLKMYSPFEHAALMSLCYLFRFLSKRSNKDEWEYVQAPLYEALEIGACIGLKVPEVGFAIGLLSRSMRYLGFGPLLISDTKAFQTYRRHLRQKDLPFDSSLELQHWGCTSIQVSALLLEAVGFNNIIAQQLVAANERSTSVEPDAKYGIPMRIAESLINSFVENGEICGTLPVWTGASLTLSKEQSSDLMISLNKVVSNADRIEWLGKSSSSLNPQSTPHLYDPVSSITT